MCKAHYWKSFDPKTTKHEAIETVDTLLGYEYAFPDINMWELFYCKNCGKMKWLCNTPAENDIKRMTERKTAWLDKVRNREYKKEERRQKLCALQTT